MTGYVAPAAKVLTVLHKPDPSTRPVAAGPDPNDGVTVCGLRMLTADLWVPVDRRASDLICGGCEGKPPDVQEALL